MPSLRTLALVNIAALPILLSACQPPRAGRVDEAPPVAVVTPVLPQAPAEPPAADTCGAAAFAGFIGQDRKTLPPMPAGKVVRELCTTCMRTMDFNAARMDVIYDQHTGVIRTINCG